MRADAGVVWRPLAITVGMMENTLSEVIYRLRGNK
jgi:hypothetical protein